mgnify:CR=1 FL=1
MKSFLLKKQHGFTLIELLLVIGIIAILASIVIVAINPTRQLGQARDAQRRADVNTIINAIYQYSIDNNGALPDALNSTASVGIALQLCKHTHVRNGTTCSNTLPPNGANSGTVVSLRALTGSYIVGVPNDPSRNANNTGTGYAGYRVTRDAAGRITVSAVAETAGSPAITVTR